MARRYNVSYKKSGPIKVIKADGTVEIKPAYKQKEVLKIIQDGKDNRYKLVVPKNQRKKSS